MDRALAKGNLPTDATSSAPDVDTLAGAGTFDYPWQITDNIRMWLEPEGPPLAWATGAGTQATAATDYDSLAQAVHLLGRLQPPLAAALGDMTPDDISTALQALGLHLANSDGVVPPDSQSPAIFGWTSGDPIDNAHQNLPSDPAAITQILSQADALVDAGHPRLVLLLGPSFADRHAWDALLASPAHRRGGCQRPFNLRTGDPTTVSLNDVTRWRSTTGGLSDNNNSDVSRLVGQIDNIGGACMVQPGRAITWSGHSTAGVAARPCQRPPGSRARCHYVDALSGASRSSPTSAPATESASPSNARRHAGVGSSRRSSYGARDG
jgi:hypothetical protein